MAYTTRELITRAFYLSGVIGRDIQTISGSQISEGLALLNAVLAVKGTDLRLIPYFTRDAFNTVVNQESYFIENLLAIETLTYDYNSVRFSLVELSRDQYFGQTRAQNISSLPFNFFPERELEGTRIYMYFLPDNIYPMTITGKYGLTQTTLNQDLSLVYDLFYIEYLRYALAEYICMEYDQTFPVLAQRKLDEIQKKLMDVSPPDLSLNVSSYFNGGGALNWAVINLSYGYIATGGNR